ncbi:MAG: hypothetical protein U0270_34350 [Labilithrix sp.]
MRGVAWIASTMLGTLALLVACDDPPKAALAEAGASASEPPPPPPIVPRDGCLRSGLFDGVENDPACAVKTPPTEDMVRASMKQLEIAVAPEATETYAGGTVIITLTIRNTSPNEAQVWLESRSRSTGARTDWSRVVGVPEPHAGVNEVPKLWFPVTTTDQWDRDVDGVPTTGTGAAPVPTPLLVRVPPGKKLVRKIEWFALRIPAPAPMFQDDAGHRFYPKTLALPLTQGEYGVAIDLPFFALSKEERKQTLRLKVLAHPDAGARN